MPHSPKDLAGPARGAPFSPTECSPLVQELLRTRLVPVEAVVRGFPRRLRVFATLAVSAPRGLLRALSLRDDWEAIEYYCALSVEPYRFLRDPRVSIISPYLSAVDRFVAGKMGKT